MSTRCPNCGSMAVSSRIVTKEEVDLVDPLDFAKEKVKQKSSFSYTLYPYYPTTDEILQIVVYCEGCGYTEVYSRSELENE